MSSFFPMNVVVCQGCMLAPSLFSTCMDWVLGRVVEQVIVEYVSAILRSSILFLPMMQYTLLSHCK